MRHRILIAAVLALCATGAALGYGPQDLEALRKRLGLARDAAVEAQQVATEAQRVADEKSRRARVAIDEAAKASASALASRERADAAADAFRAMSIRYEAVVATVPTEPEAPAPVDD
ncbi:MAG: hypothetical protein AAFQ53_14835, partial [Bacteroidota bacterium]